MRKYFELVKAVAVLVSMVAIAGFSLGVMFQVGYICFTAGRTYFF